MPWAQALATAGAMTSISSRPNEPLSPLCGFRPHTAMRGLATPLRLSSVSIRRIASTTPSWVIIAGTSASATCEVTREVHRPSSTLNSQNGAGQPRRSANQCSSSLWAMPAMCIELLFSGPNRMASVAPPLGLVERDGQRVEAVAAALDGGDAALERAFGGAAVIVEQRFAGREVELRRASRWR